LSTQPNFRFTLRIRFTSIWTRKVVSRWLIFIALIPWLAIRASAQSAAAGQLIVKEDFRSGDDQTRRRFKNVSFNVPETWELRAEGIASIFDSAKHPSHGWPISALCKARDLRISYRARLDSDKSSLSVMIDGDWPNKTGLPLWHIGDVDARIQTNPEKPEVYIMERYFTRDPETPGVRDKVWKPGGLNTDMHVLAPAYYPGNRMQGARPGLKRGQWYQFVIEIVGADWRLWIDGKETVKSRLEYTDCEKRSVNFLGFGPLVMTDLVVEELPRPAPLDLVIVAGDEGAFGEAIQPVSGKPEVFEKTVPFWWQLGEESSGSFASSGGERWMEFQLQPLVSGVSRAGGTSKPAGVLPKIGGPELGMHLRMRAQGGMQQLAFLKVAFPRTGFQRGWNPAESNREGGACYRALFSAVRSALRAGRLQGLNFRLRALVFVQGRNDATAEGVEKYEERLADFIKAFRGDFSAQDMRVLLAVGPMAGVAPYSNEFIARVKEAQRKVASSLPGCFALEESDHPSQGGERPNLGATVSLGVSLAEVLLREESRGGKPAPPR
jgi:hypothetical protein